MLGSGHDQPRAGATAAPVERTSAPNAACWALRENGFAASAAAEDAAKPATAPTAQAVTEGGAARLRWRKKCAACIWMKKTTGFPPSLPPPPCLCSLSPPLHSSLFSLVSPLLSLRSCLLSGSLSLGKLLRNACTPKARRLGSTLVRWSRLTVGRTQGR